MRGKGQSFQNPPHRVHDEEEVPTRGQPAVPRSTGKAVEVSHGVKARSRHKNETWWAHHRVAQGSAQSSFDSWPSGQGSRPTGPGGTDTRHRRGPGGHAHLRLNTAGNKPAQRSLDNEPAQRAAARSDAGAAHDTRAAPLAGSERSWPKCQQLKEGCIFLPVHRASSTDDSRKQTKDRERRGSLD